MNKVGLQLTGVIEEQIKFDCKLVVDGEAATRDISGAIYPQLVNLRYNSTQENYDSAIVSLESSIKATCGVIPSAFRSAKSVIKSAATYSIPLWEADNTIKGKSQVEKEIKAAKKALVEEEYKDPTPSVTPETSLIVRRRAQQRILKYIIEDLEGHDTTLAVALELNDRLSMLGWWPND